jgi:hypothetical protein
MHAFHICQLGKFIKTEPEYDRSTFDLGDEHGLPLGGNAKHRRGQASLPRQAEQSYA